MKNKRGRICISILKKMFERKKDITRIIEVRQLSQVADISPNRAKAFRQGSRLNTVLTRSFIYVKTVCTIHLSNMTYLFVNVTHDWRNMCFGWIYCSKNARALIIFRARRTTLFRCF